MQLEQTKIRNNELDPLFLAIYFNDLEAVMAFKLNNPLAYINRHQYVVDGYLTDATINLEYLTYFNQVIWSDDNCDKETLEKIKMYRERVADMMAFWKAENGIEITFIKSQYNQYHDFFYCDDPNDAEFNNTVFDEPIANYVKRGFNEIDLLLYSNCERFNFDKVEELLQLGAKYDIHIEKDDSSSALDRILTEISFLTSCSMLGRFNGFEKKKYKQQFDIAGMFGDLLGLAAHQEMENLFNKYTNKTI
jgi:hypothetical protein